MPPRSTLQLLPFACHYSALDGSADPLLYPRCRFVERCEEWPVFAQGQDMRGKLAGGSRAVATILSVSLVAAVTWAGEPPAKRVARFEAWEREALIKLGGPIRIWSQARLAELPGASDALEVGARVVVIEVTTAKVVLEGEALGENGVPVSKELGSKLEDLQKGFKARNPEAPDRLPGLAIAADAPWGLVVEALEGIRASGGTKVALVFAGVRPPPIPSSAVSAEVIAAAKDRWASAKKLSAVLRKILQRCAVSAELPDALEHVNPADRPSIFLLGAKESLEQPSCDVDEAALRAVGWGYLVDGRAQVGQKALVLSLAKEGVEVAFTAKTKWNKAAPAVIKVARDGKALRPNAR
ncbi:MAG: hypothetical protein HY901_23045 [Deltaproteobacteria bacterium]|nr:hypothetical protein [Deltaproteobacteria bacterium]